MTRRTRNPRQPIVIGRERASLAMPNPSDEEEVRMLAIAASDSADAAWNMAEEVRDAMEQGYTKVAKEAQEGAMAYAEQANRYAVEAGAMALDIGTGDAARHADHAAQYAEHAQGALRYTIEVMKVRNRRLGLATPRTNPSSVKRRLAR